MFGNYLKTAWRNIVKRRFYSTINIFGMALGIACSLFLYLFISFHLSFDNYHKKSATTYRIVNEVLFEKTVHQKGASMGMYEALQSNIPQVTGAAVMITNNAFTVTLNDRSITKKRFREDRNIAFVSPEWFNLFEYDWVAGNPGELKAPNTVVLSQEQAVKYFGNSNPVGEILWFENKQPVKVVGLINNRPNTDLKAGMYVSVSSFKNLKPGVSEKFFTDWAWISAATDVYLSLTDNKAKAKVEAALADMAKDHLGDIARYYHFKLQPLADVHFNSSYGASIQKPMLFTLLLIGSLILIISSINYINLTIAQQARRSVEIGTRKVLGGLPRQLFTQFMTETIVTTLFSVFFAIAMVVLILPIANQTFFADEPLSIISYGSVTLFLGILFILLVALSGFYPALILSRINVFKALKNETGNWKAGLLGKILVVMQNSAAQTLIVCTLIMLLQVSYLKHSDVGYNRDAVVMVPLPDSSEQGKYLLGRELQSMSQVRSFSFCFKAPSSENDRGGSVHFGNRPDWESWPACSALGDTSYVKSFGLEIIAGRNLKASDANPEFLVNQAMINKLGLKNAGDALGKTLIAGELKDKKGTIVGVVKDFNTKSLVGPIEPVLITGFKEMHSTVAIKLNQGNLQDAIGKIRKTYEKVYPGEMYDYQFLDDQIANLYKKEALQQKLMLLAASVAVTISCLGLIGLISLVTLQRTKEIGIRKVLGASVSSIVAVLTMDFIKLILISVLLASVGAWWIMKNWLQDFAYRVNISWWIFVATGLLALLIAMLTIGFQAIKAAVANPVKSLRTE